jgi:hypothetical protein
MNGQSRVRVAREVLSWSSSQTINLELILLMNIARFAALGLLFCLVACGRQAESAVPPEKPAAPPAAVAAPYSVPETNLLKYKWTISGAAKDKTGVNLVQDDSGLVATVDNLNGNTGETAPHLTVSLGGLQDWRRYQTIRCRMRLTSDKPIVTAGGKPIAFCFYDEQTRREMQPITLQQTVRGHLAGNEWQDFVIDLRPFGRSQISGSDIYLYVLPYGVTHQYKVEVSKFELVQDDRPMFDGKGMDAALPAAGGEAFGKLAAGDGFGLQIAKSGGISGVTVGGREIGGTAQAGGVLIRDNASDAPPVLAGGEIKSEGGATVQHAALDPLGLKVDTRYQAEGNRIHVSIHAANQGKNTRFLTLYFALPLQKRAWSWGRDINRTFDIPADSDRPFEENAVQYPLATLATPAAGIALALPLDQPRNYRLAYNEQTGLFYAAFDVALADLKTPAGQSLNEVTCDVYVYPVDPQWGFRDALQTYYAAFPQWFAKHTQRDGGWDIDRIRAPGYSKEEILASGCRFAWEQSPNAMWPWQSKHGILNTIYVEPEYIQLSMSDLEPSDAAASERLNNLTNGDDAEWAKMLKLHYTQRYANTMYAGEHGLKGYHQLLGRAAYVSGIWRSDHKPELGVGFAREWIGENGSGMMIPCNVDPQIPGGRGQAAITLLETEAKGYHDKLGLTTDGWSLDSFVCDDTYDYRAENFRYSSNPLTFERSQVPLEPSVLLRFSMAAWLKELAARGRPSGKVTFINVTDNFTFAAPYADIFGTEGESVHDPAYHRSMAYHKSITYLPYTPKPDLDVFFNLLYGIYPGRGLVQEQYLQVVPVLDQITPAGWEPVTHARTDAPHVRVERFGSGKTCYLVFHNNDPAARAFQVTVDGKALGTAGQKATVLFGPQKGQTVAAANGSLPFQLGSRETCVVKLD